MGNTPNIQKIKNLAKSQKRTITGVCEIIGKHRGFLNDVSRGINHITDDQLRAIADFLDTTVEYLTDKTDYPAGYNVANVSGPAGALNFYRLDTRCMIVGTTLERLEQELNLSPSTLREARYGIKPLDSITIERIANFLLTTKDYLTNLTDDPTKSVGRKVRIKVWGEVAAGRPIEAVEDFFTDDSDNWEEIDYRDAEHGDYFALRVKGDSMEPEMKKNDVVIVRQQNHADNGDFVIVSFDDSVTNARTATCKEFRRENGGIKLISLNPKYSPFYFTGDDINRMRVAIMGKVVEIRRRRS